jgi:hypothetical protein
MDNNMSLAIYVGLAILLIAYFVISFFSGKTWKVTHVLLAVCVFFASAVFFVMAVMTLKTHREWREVYLRLEAEVAEQNFQNELLEKGVGRDPKGDLQEQEDSVRELQEKVDQELYDRARVWRKCGLQGFDGNTVTLTMIPPDEAASAGEDLRIADKAILYAFKETQSPEGWNLPSAYLGEFQVEGKTQTQLTLKPTLPLDQVQTAEIRSGGSWVLYELMPVDSYHAFASLRDETAADPDADFAAKMRQLLPAQKLGFVGPAYDRLINEYVRDRKPADLASDPPGRIWKRVRFIKAPEAIKVDSDDEQAQAALRYYDAMGRAVPAALRTGDVNETAISEAATSEKGVIHGIKNLVSNGNIAMEAGEIKFDIDDEALLDSETADKLIADGVAEEIEAVFVRELRDYAFEFHDLYMRMIDLDDFASRLTYDTKVLVGAGDNANIRVVYRTGERDTLQADLDRFQAEREALAEYYAQLQAQHQQLMADLSLLYRTNNTLAAELARNQYNLARSINAKTQTTEPTESAPRGATPPPSAP